MTDATQALALAYGKLVQKTSVLVAQVNCLLELYHETGHIHHETEESVLKTIEEITEKTNG